MITNFLQKNVIEYVDNKIHSAKLIVNDVVNDVVIKDKVIRDNKFIDIYVDFTFASTSDIINGIMIYDEDGNLLAKDLLNITYNVQSATYVYTIDVTSKKQILEN